MAETTLRNVYALIREGFGKGKKKKKKKSYEAGDVEISEEGLLAAERRRVKERQRYEEELGYEK